MPNKIKFHAERRYLAGPCSNGGTLYIPYDKVASVNAYTVSKKKHGVDVHSITGVHSIFEECESRMQAELLATAIMFAIARSTEVRAGDTPEAEQDETH